MAIPVMQFQPQSFMQANPEIQAMSAPLSLADQYQTIQNKIAQQGLTQAGTQLRKAQIGYLPLNEQIKQAQLADQEATLKNTLLNSPIDRELKRQQINKILQGLTLNPEKLKLAQQQLAETSSRFGGAYQLAKFMQLMSPSVRDFWSAKHMPELDTLANMLGNIGLKQGAQDLGAIPAPTQPTDPLMRSIQQNLQLSAPSTGTDQTTAPATTQPATPVQQPTAPVQQPATPETTQPATPVQQPAQPTKNVMQETAKNNSFGQMQPGLSTKDIGNEKSIRQFSTTLPEVQREQLVAYSAANEKQAGTKMWNRAVAAVQLEKFLTNNQQQYAKRINTALQYAGLLGRSKRLAQAWANRNPDALSDYDWFKNGGFTLFTTNGIKLMDGMGATDQQKKELKDSSTSLDTWESNPERARLNFNKFVETLHQNAKSILSAAQPVQPGVLQKLYGLTPSKGDYLAAPGVAGNGSTVRMQTPDGTLWNVPPDQIDIATKRGAKRL
jgi:hypothetical protein